MSNARGNGSQACAACKYQRRKCAPDCILAPYFPHDRQTQFLNAHKLFGVSNITKIIRNLDQPSKDEAMRTIIFQSDVRAADPVGGCYAIIRDLHRQIQQAKAELHLVLHQLQIYRAQPHHLDPTEPTLHFDTLASDDPFIAYQTHHDDDYAFQYNNNNGGNNHVAMHDIASWAMQDSGGASASVQDKQALVVGVCDDDDVEIKLPPLETRASEDRLGLKLEAEDTIDHRFEPLTLSILSS